MLIVFNSYGQTPIDTKREAKIHFEPFVGFPSSQFLLAKNIDTAISSNLEVSGNIFLLGLKCHFSFSKNRTLGLECSYQKIRIVEHYSTPYQVGILEYPYYNYYTFYSHHTDDWTEERIRLLLRYEQIFRTERKFDFYYGMGLGLHFRLEKGRNPLDKYDGPYSYSKFLLPLSIVQHNISKSKIPFSARVFIGSRFMISKNIGVFSEFGLFGGSLIQIGTTVKL